MIPHDRWQPLSVIEVTALFADAPFTWGIAGGHALELFIREPIRDHDDIDVVVFRDEQRDVRRWLTGWQLYAADPPGSLRPWQKDEFLPVGVHDIWGHRLDADTWQLQLMLIEVEGGEWVSRRDPAIRGLRAGLIETHSGVPCIRPEVQLIYKARNPRPKDQVDFDACLPHLSAEQRRWLAAHLPEGHEWLTPLR
jgi:hypothetical protein